MKKVIVSIAVVLSLNSFSQTKTTPEELMTDIVNVSDGKYKMDVYRLITNADNTTIQVKAHSDAPQSVISRDQFLFYATSIMHNIIDAMTPETSKSQDLDELIGNADIEINV